MIARRRSRAAAFATLTIAFTAAAIALAQPHKHPPAGGHGGKPHGKEPPSGATASGNAGSGNTGNTGNAGGEGVDAAAPITTRGESARLGGNAAPKDAGVVEAKTLDGGARVFRFGEVDIEGRLRSPQIVYFLRRVRAEFAAGDLGHRTFMRELSETRKESEF